MIIKYVKTIKDYKVKYKLYDLIIPAGSLVSNQTACGPDDNYRYWVIDNHYIEQLTGSKNSLLLHDLSHYGLNIPKEYCKPYPKLNRRLK
jgi:hypothetical protein